MRTIETVAAVSSNGQITISAPLGIEQGEYRVVLVIEEQPLKKATRRPLDLPAHDCGPWPENLSLRREDMYDDWGR